MYLSKQSVRDIEKNTGNKQIHLRRLYNRVNKQRKKNNQNRMKAKIVRPLTAGAKELPKSFILELDNVQYTITHELASGMTGSVFKGTDANNKEVVIKQMPKYKSGNKKSFQREVAAYAKIKGYEGHENIVELLGSHEDDQHFYLIFPFLENEDFLFVLEHPNKTNATQRMNMLYQVVKALHFLHTINLAHLDIKCENVFVDKDLNVKIGDFGFAKVLPNDDSIDSVQGTLDYLSPEIYLMMIHRKMQQTNIQLPPFVLEQYGGFLMINQLKYSAKRADAWALGILFCVVLFETNIMFPLWVVEDNKIKGINPNFEIIFTYLKEPNKNMFFQYLNKHANTTYTQLDPEMQKKCKEWIRGLLQFDPAKRMSVSDLYEEVKNLK
jgi:serine/threonine protein kinase